MKPLNGKNIVVTGSGRGIGAAVARAAAAEGACVVVNDISREHAEQVTGEIVRAGGKAVAEVADISTWGGAAAVVERCVSEFGRIDGLVNNAGLFSMGTIDELNEADLRALLEVNVLGTAFCARHAAPHMIRQKSGSIVNVTSGSHFGIPMMSGYGGSKGAVASFTYAWSAELKLHGVRVNALSPMAKTRMMDTTAAYLALKGLPPFAGTQPEPQTNAPVVLFLLSDASKNVTGQLVRIEGGQLALLAHPGVLVPTLHRDAGWSLDAIAHAFDSDLVKRQLPTGVVGLKVEPTELASAFWKASGT